MLFLEQLHLYFILLQDTKKQEKQDKKHQPANPHLEEEGTRKVTCQEEEKMMKGQEKKTKET